MRAVFGALFAISFAAASLGGGSAARSQTVTAESVDTILSMAQSFGPAELNTSTSGRPLIRGEMEGVTYVILFYGAECVASGAGCSSIQFGAIWEAGADPSPVGPDLPRVNEWNRAQRFGGAYIETDGRVILKMEVNLDFGIDRRTLEDTFAWWRIALREFPAFYF